MSFFPVELSGSSREIGLKRGQIFRDSLTSLAGDLLPCYVGEKRDEHEKIAKRMRRDLEETFPQFAEELKGVAEGSGLSEQEVFMLDAWWENVAYPARFPSNCTCLAFTKSNVGPIMGQTADIGRTPYFVMVLIKPKKGYSFLSTLRVDMLGAGRSVNEKGLCMGGGTVGVKDRGEGLSRPAVMRAVIQGCANVEEAVNLLKDIRMGRSTGENILLLDASGNAAVVEKSTTKWEVRKPKNGGICVTNHFVTNAMKDVNAISKEGLERYSEARFERLMHFIKTGDRIDAVKSFKEILRSHGFGGLCYHGDPWPYPASTQFANIILPEQREMLVSSPMGPPCQSQFIRFKPFS